MNSLHSNSTHIPTQFSSALDSVDSILWWTCDTEIQKNIFANLLLYHRYADFHWLPISEKVVHAINTLSIYYDVPPVMTYESLILLNKFNDDAVVFSENHGEQELLFYKTHQDIEYLFYDIHIQIQWAYLGPNRDLSVVVMTESLQKIIQKLYTLMKCMSTESFSAIRPYWDLTHYSQKDENGDSYPWPSWAYTCWFVYLDLVLWIKSVDTKLYSIDDRMLPNIRGNGYITKHDLDELRAMVKERWLLKEVLPWQSKQIWKLQNQLLRFRLGHMQAARKYVWDENLEKPWTWGAINARKFLENHINATKSKLPKIL